MQKSPHKIIVLSITIILFISLYFILNSNNHLFADQAQILKNDKELELKDETYILERDNNERFFRIEVKYPQIKNNLSKEINIILKDTAFSLFERKTSKNAISFLEENKKEKKCSMGAFVDYDILELTDTHISLIFSADVSEGSGSIYSTQYLATIDLKTGQYILLDKLIDIDQLVSVIQQGNFEIYEGDYNELKDGHDIKVIQKFIEKIKNSESTTLNSDYERDSCQNIGVDKDFLYIYFDFPDSLNGYIILKIPLDNIKLRISLEDETILKDDIYWI